MPPAIRMCAECVTELPKSSFTKNQWTKGPGGSRCIPCVSQLRASRLGFGSEEEPSTLSLVGAGLAASDPEGTSPSQEISVRSHSSINRNASRYYDDDYDGEMFYGEELNLYARDYPQERSVVIQMPLPGTRNGMTAIECLRQMPRETASKKASRYAARRLSSGTYITGTHGRPTSTFCFYPGCRDDACGDDQFIFTCSTCTIALYCSEQHLLDDSERHSSNGECNGNPSFKKGIQERIQRAYLGSEHGPESRKSCFQVRDQKDAAAVAWWLSAKNVSPSGIPLHLPYSAYVSITGRNIGSSRRPMLKILHAIVKIFQSTESIQHQSLDNTETMFWFVIPSPRSLSSSDSILHMLTLLSTVVSGASALVNNKNNKPSLFPSERFLSYEEEHSSQGSLILDEEDSRCRCGGYLFNGPPAQGWFGGF